ncbi:TPA: hypothetical protein NIB55_005008 [Pseudomonas aeruginosa]|nr:hypothetical protein [Pseudomonas aeruginosa]
MIRIDCKRKGETPLVINAETFILAGEKLFDQYLSWPDCNMPVTTMNIEACKVEKHGDLYRHIELFGREHAEAIKDVRRGAGL